MEGTRSWWMLVLLVVVATSANGQSNRYMVFFKDKAGSQYSTSAPQAFLSDKAIARRVKEDVAITEQDIPVNASYLSTLSATGVDVFFTTRWMNGALIQCDAALIGAVQNLSFVDHVEFVAPQAKLQKNGRHKFSLRKKTSPVNQPANTTQLTMLGIPTMHADGFKGEGIDIAIFDGGFYGVNHATPFQHVFSEGRFNETLSHDFVKNTDNVFQYDDHGTNVFSVIAGFIPDGYVGGAYKSNFQLYVTEDVTTEYRIEEYNWLFAAERADSAGVDIISSSLGYYDFDFAAMNYSKAQMDGQTTVVTRAAQWAADRGILVVISAGNEGNIASWRIITAPADAEGVIAVANVNSSGVVSSSSSIGPSADGRIKPDLAALGTGVVVLNDQGNITTNSGTSLAAPLITSLVAGVKQAYPDLSREELVTILKETATMGKNPNNSIGYGIPSYVAVKNYIDRSDQTSLFTVFPNPVGDSLIVRPIDPETVSNCSIELLNFIGQRLVFGDVAFSWSHDRWTWDMTPYAPGIYFVRVTVGDQRFVFKIIKRT